MMMMIS